MKIAPFCITVIFVVSVVLLTIGLMKTGLGEWPPPTTIAQNDIRILREAKKTVNSLPGWTLLGKYDKATALATLAIAEQLKRIADALERR